MNIEKKDLIYDATKLLKDKGFKKKNLTWVKYNDDIGIVVNIQGSQYDTESFYINLGVYIKSLGTKGFPNISDCQLQERVNVQIKNTDFFINVIDKWEEWYGTTDKIRARINEGKMPILTDKKIFAYFLVSGWFLFIWNINNNDFSSNLRMPMKT